MQITDILASAHSGQAIANLATAYGIDPEAAARATNAVVNEMAQRIERNTLSRGGVADIVRMMGRSELGKLLADPKAVPAADVESLGIDVLDEVFWTKDRSRGVAARVAAESGVPADLVKKMLPTIAAMAMAGLAEGASGDLGRILGQVTGSPLPLPRHKPARSADPSAPSPVPGPTTGSREVGQQSPLPVPGESRPVPRRRATDRAEVPEEDNPYGDLGDIIRRGGFPGGQGGSSGGGDMSGGGLADLIRGILGKVLGFENKGALAWIINYLIVRWGIGFVKRLLSRIFQGR